MEKIKEKENDVLSIILENDSFFKSFTSTQDELSAFLIAEKERRESASLSLEIAFKAEASRQKSALDKIDEMLGNLNCTACSCSIILEELKKEEKLRKMKVQEILEGFSEEESRRRSAFVVYDTLLDARFSVVKPEIIFPRDYQEFELLNIKKLQSR